MVTSPQSVSNFFVRLLDSERALLRLFVARLVLPPLGPNFPIVIISFVVLYLNPQYTWKDTQSQPENGHRGLKGGKVLNMLTMLSSFAHAQSGGEDNNDLSLALRA